MALRFHKLRVAILAAFGLGCIEDVAREQDPVVQEADAGGQGGSGGAVLDAGRSGGNGDAAGGGGAEQSLACEGAVPMLHEGLPSGAVRCPDGTIDRVEAVRCDPAQDDWNQCENAEHGDCSVDADCDAAPFGRCVDRFWTCGCQYGCETADDCGEGQICLCAGVVDGLSRCIETDCGTGADCASGACGVGTKDDGCSVEIALVCRTTDDPCRTHEACAGDPEGASYCFPVDGAWACDWPPPDCGRPLHIDDLPRTAPEVNRADWVARLSPEVTGLADDERGRLAKFWSEIGALEHASVAGFARFSLQLMALGAPPELLAGAQEAGADEVEHARLAYGLASAYLGRPIGPGPTVLDDLRIETDLATVVRDLVREACVGETLGATEAESSAQVSRDPAVRAVWRRVADDEARHAVLGWRTLAWLLDGADDALRDVARATFATEIGRRIAPVAARPGIEAHGLLGTAQRVAARHEAVRDVIAPCARALGVG